MPCLFLWQDQALKQAIKCAFSFSPSLQHYYIILPIGGWFGAEWARAGALCVTRTAITAVRFSPAGYRPLLRAEGCCTSHLAIMLSRDVN